MKNTLRNVLLLFLGLVLFATGQSHAGMTTITPVIPYTVVLTLPHNPAAFTEGLTITDGILYEGTGAFADKPSTLSRIDLESGQVLSCTTLSSELFGEGIAVVGEQIYQLTWKNQVALVYDRQSLTKKRTMNASGPGWGLAYDGQNLIRSDGSDTLYLHEVDSFTEIGTLQVTDGGEPVKGLNELEVVGERIFANIWKTDRIAIIDLASGVVTGWLDLSGLPHPEDWKKNNAFLNGIAYDQTTDRLYVTGKLWPLLFEIDLR